MSELNERVKSSGAAVSPRDPADDHVKEQGPPLDRAGTEREEAAGRSGAPEALDDPRRPPLSESS